MDENSLSNLVINRAIKVHKTMGPGLLESSYLECLFYELIKADLRVEKDKPLPLIYERGKARVWLPGPSDGGKKAHNPG
jgi:GxxExxY protein